MTRHSDSSYSATGAIVSDVAAYYGDKLAKHGPIAGGVDWKDEDSQYVRFEALLKLVEDPAASLLDVGCGYGALLPYARARGFIGTYVGTDIAPSMVAAARRLHGSDALARFEQCAVPDERSDYVISSGIFNVRLGHETEEWQAYMEATVAHMDRCARRGFGFNCLTSYSDADRMRRDLYYADPLVWFDLCKRRYARSVALLHDYGLWEWTLIVRKDR